MENKAIKENDVLKYADEQFKYHTEKANQWKLFIDASNNKDVNNFKKDVTSSSHIVADFSKPIIKKPVNQAFLSAMNEIFKENEYSMKTARQWYEKYLTYKDVAVAFPTFYANLKELVLNKKISNLTVDGVSNTVKYWYGSLLCFNDDGTLKEEYKNGIEKEMKELLTNKNKETK